MIRTCPKCGDFYADGLLAFCLIDGTPLVDLDPLSETWREGTRVIEEKENALRKQRRKMKRRRVLMSVMTMLIATMVVCVVAANSIIYLKPKQKEAVLTRPLTLAAAPAEPGDSITRSATDEPVPSPTPQPTVTPSSTASPIAAEIATPTPTPVLTSTPAPTPTSTPTPTPTPTPRPTPSPTPSPTPTPKPSPMTTPTIFSTPNPTPTPPPPVCSDADKSRERETIINRFADIWRRNIEGERRKIIAANAPVGVENAEASLGAIEYASTFFKACTASFVTARYVWQVRTNVNGTIKVVNVPKEKRFACVKIGGAWLCN